MAPNNPKSALMFVPLAVTKNAYKKKKYLQEKMDTIITDDDDQEIEQLLEMATNAYQKDLDLEVPKKKKEKDDHEIKEKVRMNTDESIEQSAPKYRGNDFIHLLAILEEEYAIQEEKEMLDTFASLFIDEKVMKLEDEMVTNMSSKAKAKINIWTPPENIRVKGIPTNPFLFN